MWHAALSVLWTQQLVPGRSARALRIPLVPGDQPLPLDLTPCEIKNPACVRRVCSPVCVREREKEQTGSLLHLRTNNTPNTPVMYIEGLKQQENTPLSAKKKKKKKSVSQDSQNSPVSSTATPWSKPQEPQTRSTYHLKAPELHLLECRQ